MKQKKFYFFVALILTFKVIQGYRGDKIVLDTQTNKQTNRQTNRKTIVDIRVGDYNMQVQSKFLYLLGVGVKAVINF